MLSVPQQAISIEDNFQNFVGELNAQGEVEFMFLDFLAAHSPCYYTYGHVHSEGQADRDINQKWHLKTGEILPISGEVLSTCVLDFHSNFMLPRTLGRALLGVVWMV